MSVTLFDPNAVDLTKLGPKRQTEPDFYFYQTSGSADIGRVRDLLEEWFAVYPAGHQGELRQRIRTAKRDINSPFWELLLYTVFTRMGAVVAVHPKVGPRTDKRPDFLVRMPNGFEFYLEAVLATGVSDEERARDNMVRLIYEIIDSEMKDERFFLSVENVAMGVAQPSAKKLLYDLARYLRQLDPAVVGADLVARGFDTQYRYVWQDDGWQFEFVPIPRKQESIGKGHRPIGAYPGRVVMCTANQDIRAAVQFKLDHHRELDKSYIIAVNATHWSAKEKGYIDALYGSDAVWVGTAQDGSRVTREERVRDGIWADEQGTRNDRLIAVIGASGIMGIGPSSVASRCLTIFPNPYVEFPADAQLGPLRQAVAVDGVLRLPPQAPLAELLGLPVGWPADSDEADRSDGVS